MERTPYCLDFDIVQVARTAIPGSDARGAALKRRVGEYAGAILDFYGNRLGDDYALHKLPGGLATLHECALAESAPCVPGLEVAPVDIAKQAHWI
jgi:hypothetical protein